MRLTTADESRVAKLYWRRDLRTNEIASRFGISRHTVVAIARRRKKMALSPDREEGLIDNPETGRDPEKDTRVSPDRNEGDA